MSTLRTTAFQLASLALFIGSATQAMAEDITFVSQGGAYQEAQSKAILEPAAKKLGLTLKQDSSPKAYPIIKTQVESGKVTWDVVDLPTGDCIRGEAEGLFEKLDLALIPNAAQYPTASRTNTASATSATPRCWRIARTRSKARTYPRPGPVSYTHLTLPTTPYV